MASAFEKYKQYRKIARELSSKMMEKYVKANVLDSTGRLLGMTRGGVFVFASENETNAFMDFALFEYRVGKKNAVEMYREEIGGKDEREREKEILDAFVSSYTSLFRIVAVSKSDHSLILRDLLNNREDAKLTDIGFSQTAVVGYLLFLRIVPFNDFNMTSGIAFVFPGDLESYLLRKYKKLAKKVPSESDSIKHFVSFFQLNRTDGLEVRYE